MLPIAKSLTLIVAVGLVLLALLFVIFDAVRHENEKRNKHFHTRYGCKQVCFEPGCKDWD